jgi:hypothetical protein
VDGFAGPVLEAVLQNEEQQPDGDERDRHRLAKADDRAGDNQNDCQQAQRKIRKWGKS